MPSPFRKALLLAWLCPAFSPVHGQRLELYADLHHSHYYDNEEGIYQSEIVSRPGFSIGVSADSIKGLDLTMLLQYDHYSGMVSASEGILGAGHSVNMAFSNSMLTAMALPVHIRPASNAEIRIGAWFSVLLSESYAGDYFTWRTGMDPVTNDFEDAYPDFSRKSNWGISGRMSFDMPVSPTLVFSPHFSFMIGLAEEFAELPDQEKSLRFHFGIGFIKSLVQERKDGVTEPID